MLYSPPRHGRGHNQGPICREQRKPWIQCYTSHPTTCYEKYFYDGTRAIESRRTASRRARSHGTTYEEQLVDMAYQRGLDSSRVECGLTGGYVRRL